MMRLALCAALAAAFAACAPCEDVQASLAEACLPSSMASDQELEIEVREACGTSCSEPPDCTSVLDVQNGGTITVVTSQSECRVDCTPDGTCRQRTVKCLLPAVPPGEYTVVLPGLSPRTLAVDPGAPASCTL